MRTYLPYILSLLFLLNFFVFLSQTKAQKDSLSMVKYGPDYKFIDGIFINFDQVKQNKPVSTARIVTDKRPGDLDYFESLLETERVYFIDDMGVKQSIAVGKLWGYAKNGVLYIYLNGEFNRIPVVGKACHFVANKTVVHESYDPFYRYNYPYQTPTYSSKEIRQYLLDFETGAVMDYNIGALEVVLMNDAELHAEFLALKKRKRRQQKFLFLRRYNERNPLYLPAY